MNGKNEPSALEKIRAAHRNLVVLRALKALPAYRTNELVLRDILDHFGIPSAAEDLRAGLRSLEDLATITTDTNDALILVRLTQRGEDVASGLLVLDGVQRPGPECPY
jgi:hypothetical protein